MEFGEKLQSLRKASNLNQEQLADMLNVSRQSVSKWESGATYPEMDKLIAMAKIFNCSMDDLVNNEVKGKDITTTKNKQVGQYADGLLNFIVDTVNMFFSMKFTTLVKTLFELFIIGFILFGGGLCIIALSYDFIDNNLYISNDIIDTIVIFLFLVEILFVVAVTVISFLQIFKIRYLDYYRKAVYEENQVKDLKLEINNKNDLEINDDNHKNSFKKIKEPVIIMRDPKCSSLKFLERFVKMIKRVMEFFVLMVLAMILIPTSFLLIIGLVIGTYLISVNSIFVGVVLGLVGLTVVCYEVYELVYDYIVKRKPATRKLAIMFIASLVISSVGVGLSLIKLKDIKIIDIYDKRTVFSETLDFKDDLTITTDIEETIYFIVDDSLKNVKVDVEYNKEFMGVSLVDRKNAKYVEFDYKNYSSYNEINKILDGLRNNIFYNDYYDGYNKITIRANETNIKKMINNLADRNLIYTINVDNGYAVELEDNKRDIDKCYTDLNGIKRCYRVYDNDNCQVTIDSNGKITSLNKDCNCALNRDKYYCYANKNDDNEVYE